MKKFLLLSMVVFINQFFTFGQDKTAIIYSAPIKSQSEMWQILRTGTSSFEVSLMYIYGDLVVTSSMPDNASHSVVSFTEGYLLPLFNQFKKTGRLAENTDSQSYLILHIPHDNTKVYEVLSDLLYPFREMLTYKTGSEWHRGKLQLVIDDDSVLQNLENGNSSFLFFEGNANNKVIASELMPLVKLSFYELTGWNGIGSVSFDNFQKIKDKLEYYQINGVKVYVSDCPCSTAAKNLLLSLGVDFVEVKEFDKLNKLSHIQYAEN